MDKRETKNVKIVDDGEFTICPECGYKDGFHNSFEGLNSSNPAKWLLICPMCSARFDIGLKYNK